MQGRAEQPAGRAGGVVAAAAVALVAAIGVPTATSGDPVRPWDDPEVGATWGISGPDFLVLYAVTLGLAVVVTFAVRAGAWRWDARRLPEVDDLAEPMEVASLAGGRHHAVQVAHLDLYEKGLVEVPDEVLERTDPTGPSWSRSPRPGRRDPATAPSMPKPPHTRWSSASWPTWPGARTRM